MFQYFGHQMQKADSLEKTLMMGKTEGKKRRRQQTMRWLDSIIASTNMNLSKLWEIVEDSGAWQSMGLQRVEQNLAVEQQQQHQQ